MQLFMEEISQLTADEKLREAEIAPPANSWLQYALVAIPAPARLMPVAYSIVDQALVVGGGFLVNVALARTETKREYGIFALTYSVFIFLSSLHNAAILEPFTVYGSGRYRERFSEYLRLMVRSNAAIGLLLSGILLLSSLLLWYVAPGLMSGALVGLGLTVGVLLSGIFLRRAFYVQRQSALAALCSLVFFITTACGLWLTLKMHRLDSFSVFLLLAVGWIIAGAALGRRLQFGSPKQHFLKLEPHYWQEHWNYSKWALATAFVFQFTTQGYYWLVGGFLSAREVGDLRAMYLLIAPIEQALIALSYVMAPALAARYAANRMGSLLSLWKRFVLAAVGVTVLFALAIRILGKPMMHILYAGRYDGLAAYLFVLALLPLVLWIGNTMNYGLNAVEKPKFVFWAYVCSAAATFLGGIPLVMHFGLWGAVYGMLFSGVTCTAAVAVYFILHVYIPASRQSGLASRRDLSSEPLAEETR
jgi:O-antigen/teichoic acid export membrane protein